MQVIDKFTIKVQKIYEFTIKNAEKSMNVFHVLKVLFAYT